MLIRVSIKVHLGSVRLYFFYKPACCQDVQVAIDRSHADMRHFFSNFFVNFISGEMGARIFELIKNHLSLLRHPIWFF